MAFVRHLQVTLQSATFMDPLSSSLDERMIYVKASHKNIVYTTNVVEGLGYEEVHHLWGNDGTNVFHFAYEDNSEDITLELFNRDHICIGKARLDLAGLAKVMPEQDPELKTLPVSALGRRWSYGSLALTTQIKRQQAMGKLGNLNVVLQEGIINSISSTEPRVFAKLIYKHTTYTIGILRGERNQFVWHEHFTFRINSWDPVDVLEICIYYGAFQVGECKVLLSLFINLEEDLQADRKDFVIRTEDLLVDKRSVGSIKVAGSFSTLHELDVLRAIVKGKRPELHPPRIPPPELPGLPNYASITNEIRGEGKIEADIFHTDKSKPEVQLESKEIRNAGKPTSIGDYLPIDLTRDLLGASSRGYVIRTICPDGQGGWYSCALKRINTMDDSEPDLARLCHPHVVHLFHHWKKKIDYGEVREWMPKSAFMTFFMMELMDGDLGNLMTSIKTTGLTPFSLLVAVHLMLQIAKGMLYLHEMGVSHPHVKCNNVLCRVKSTAQIPFRVGDVLVKLGGFGCSRAANDDTKNRDVLCFGLTCLEILTGDECFEDIYGADKVSRPSIPETTPCILKDCIASCLDTKITFSEAITLLLLAQSQIIQTFEDKMILCSVNLNIKSTLSNNQDLASSSTSKSDRQEMFHVHQLHPQLGEVATSVQITLIFFHGFPKVSEEWRMTWLTRDNRLVWPQMWLPEDLDGDIRVLSVSFDDRPNVSSIQSIKDLLQILVMSATCKLGETDQAIVLVGHSFGGVIIKALVAAAQGLAGKTVENNAEFEEVLKCKKFLKRLASIVFYSVPHAFTNMEFENYISGCGNTRVLQRSCLLKALRRDSVFISDMIQLSRDFENAVPRKTKLLAFLEGKPMSKKSLLVTENSWEGLLLCWEWHKIDRDNHFEVCRPVSKSHIGYKVLLNHLQQHMCSPSAVNETPPPHTPSRLVYGMNPSASSNEQQGDPSWPTENWDNLGSVGSLDPTCREFTGANRLEWDWDPAMILAQHLGSGGSNDGSDGEFRNLITAGPMSSLRASYTMMSAGLPSNFTHNPMGIFTSAGYRHYDTGVRTYFATEDKTAGGLGMRHRAGSPGSQVPMCQVEGCKADLSTAKHYHRRHRVCELHSKAPTVILGGHKQRLCQQCSRFHHLSEFDEGKRSCRKRLTDHNRRRRKPQPNASTSGGTPAESIDIKPGEDGDLHSGVNRTNDPKSMLNMHLQKNCGSPSSVSSEDSDEKPGTPGVGNLQLRTAGPGFGRGPGDDQRSSQYPPIYASSPGQGMLYLMRQREIRAGTRDYDQGNYVHQQYLQSGPNLSLGSQLGNQSGGRGQLMSGQSYNGMEPPASWLRSRPGTLDMQHLMSTDSKSGITSASANSPNSQVRRVWKVIGTVLICICKFKKVLSRYRMGCRTIEGMTPKELLLTCATAIELKDASTIKQTVSALRNISSVNGEPSERVTAYFLQALQRRCVSMLGPKFLSGADLPSSREEQEPASRWMLDVLTNFIDLSPYVRFGYVAANGAMLKAFEGMGRIHIVDFSTTHGMQWRFFIDALADRVGGPPNFRLTLSGPSLPIVPHPTYEEIGHRLTKYARLRNVPLEFNVLAPPLERLSSSDFDVRDGEALGVNFSLGLHYLADESAGLPDYPPPLETQLQPRCPRDNLLHLIRSLNPTIITLYEEDCDATSTDVVKRVQQSYEHEWIPFDFMATLLPSGNKERQEYEKIVGMKIENILACEGERRIERLESKRQWMQRMRRLGFLSLPVGYDVVSALRDILDHSWEMKNEVDECTQSLLWKGHSLAFASAWAPHFSNPAACPLDSGEHRQQQQECQKPSPAVLGSFPFDFTSPTLDDAQGTVEEYAVLKELFEEKNTTVELARLTREFLLIPPYSTQGSKDKEKMLEMHFNNVVFMTEEHLEATCSAEWFQFALQESLQEFLGESWAHRVPNEIEKWFSRDHLRPLQEYLQPFQSELLLRPSMSLEQQNPKTPNDSETTLSSVRIGEIRDSDPAVIRPIEESLGGFSTKQLAGMLYRTATTVIAFDCAAPGDASGGGGAHGTALEPQQQQQSIDAGHKMFKGPERAALAQVDMAESKRQPRYSIETRSEVDLLDDGFKWRKYGQKAEKNSAHPRNYYKCATANCPVRKRVERSAEDPSLVRTTYEGTHSHQWTNPYAAANTGNIAKQVDQLQHLLGVPQMPADTNAMQSLAEEVGPLQTLGHLLQPGSQVPPQKIRWGSHPPSQRDTLFQTSLTLLRAHQLFRLHYGTQCPPRGPVVLPGYRPGTVRGADGVEEIIRFRPWSDIFEPVPVPVRAPRPGPLPKPQHWVQ